MLAIEAQWWTTAAGKEAAIREQLGMTPVRYCRKLNDLIDTGQALAHEPVSVGRLRRLRSRRHRGPKRFHSKPFSNLIG